MPPPSACQPDLYTRLKVGLVAAVSAGVAAAPAELPGRKVLVSSGGFPSSSCTSLPLGCRSKR